MIRIALIISLFFTPAVANERWSFTDNPIQAFEELTVQDQLRIHDESFNETAGIRGPIRGMAKYYNRTYSEAPLIERDTLLEDRFLGYLMTSPSNEIFRDQDWAHENTFRLREAAQRYHVATGQTVCTLEIKESKAFPRLAQVLANVREALKKDGWGIPLFGISVVDHLVPEAVSWAPELELFARLRTAAGFGRNYPPRPAPGTNGLSASAIDTIYKAAETGNVEAVLDIIGACPKRS